MNTKVVIVLLAAIVAVSWANDYGDGGRGGSDDGRGGNRGGRGGRNGGRGGSRGGRGGHRGGGGRTGEQVVKLMIVNRTWT